MREYQSNSHKSKELAAETKRDEKRVTKVVSGKAKTRENKGRKLTDIFISDDASNVKSYLFMDVFVPAVKKLVSDVARDGIDMLLYGKTGGSSGRSGSSSKINYRSYYNDPRDDRYRDRPAATDNRFRYEDISFESRGDAEAVRRQMLDVCDRYGFVSVADMYDMADLTAPYTSNSIGWMREAVSRSEVTRTRDGYIIKLPKAIPYD